MSQSDRQHRGPHWIKEDWRETKSGKKRSILELIATPSGEKRFLYCRIGCSRLIWTEGMGHSLWIIWYMLPPAKYIHKHPAISMVTWHLLASCAPLLHVFFQYNYNKSSVPCRAQGKEDAFQAPPCDSPKAPQGLVKILLQVLFANPYQVIRNREMIRKVGCNKMTRQLVVWRRDKKINFWRSRCKSFIS